MSNYLNKYLKYKDKYLSLQKIFKQYGGAKCTIMFSSGQLDLIANYGYLHNLIAGNNLIFESSNDITMLNLKLFLLDTKLALLNAVGGIKYDDLTAECLKGGNFRLGDINNKHYGPIKSSYESNTIKECSRCKVLNENPKDICTTCGQSFTVTSSTEQSCSTCTMINPLNAARCSACETPFPPKVSLAAAATTAPRSAMGMSGKSANGPAASLEEAFFHTGLRRADPRSAMGMSSKSTTGPAHGASAASSGGEEAAAFFHPGLKRSDHESEFRELLTNPMFQPYDGSYTRLEDSRVEMPITHEYDSHHTRVLCEGRELTAVFDTGNSAKTLISKAGLLRLVRQGCVLRPSCLEATTLNITNFNQLMKIMRRPELEIKSKESKKPASESVVVNTFGTSAAASTKSAQRKEFEKCTLSELDTILTSVGGASTDLRSLCGIQSIKGIGGVGDALLYKVNIGIEIPKDAEVASMSMSAKSVDASAQFKFILNAYVVDNLDACDLLVSVSDIMRLSSNGLSIAIPLPAKRRRQEIIALTEQLEDIQTRIRLLKMHLSSEITEFERTAADSSISELEARGLTIVTRLRELRRHDLPAFAKMC
jgi:hypothetical protein